MPHPGVKHALDRFHLRYLRHVPSIPPEICPAGSPEGPGPSDGGMGVSPFSLFPPPLQILGEGGQGGEAIGTASSIGAGPRLVEAGLQCRVRESATRALVRLGKRCAMSKWYTVALVAGANIGEHYAVFEPVHGSWPSAAGKGLANPTAAILCGAMLLEHIGEAQAARRVQDAVTRVLRDGAVRTSDLGGVASTRQFTEAVVKALG
ncbi:MAG: hypothetical protein HYX97_02300 [Chloroflexi bacterium]|nr:hypothetical protein [Chloroflexota bacterium]